ncbi:MAG: RagB/SusD family nutrient uptake outer membrane protein [Prevotellaceae bacterium]|jgi:hypothetical protein|nr:RagB/SusD family nutrient uptake outer membrane protein [Prevotellaceae bacterium]
MKRNILSIGLGILSLFILVGCDSILDKGPLDKFSNENYWTSAANAEGYSNVFYNEFSGYASLFYFTTLSDDQAGQSFADWGHKTSLVSNGTWSSNYTEIRRANIMIENVPKIDATDAVKNHWIGVARLMRAYEYSRLVRMFGDVPYADKTLDISDEGILYGPRTNRDEVMDRVLEDLNFAVANINDVTSKITWSRNMAQAMKADICLFEGTFRKYRKTEDGQPAPDAAGATKFLTECKNACSAIMDKFSTLNASYQGNYNSTDLSGNPEMIFYKAYRQTILTHSLIAYICSSTQISGMSMDAFNAYLFTDGKPLALTSQDKNVIAPMDADGHLSLVNMLSVRDKRLSQTIDPVLMYVGNSFARSGGMEMTSSTGFGVCKYDNITIPAEFRRNTGSNYTHAPIFWLAVVYLNYAEACAELGSITNADLDRSINKLRDRAGLPHLTTTVGFDDPANNHGVSSLLWEIRRERRCELMFDNWFRYWDLIRWHQLDKLNSTAYPNILLGADVSNDPACSAPMKGNSIDGSKGMVREYDKKYYLYPIPTGQIDLNPQLGQNPGW